MRIGLDVQSTRGPISGIGAYTRGLARALKALPDVDMVPLSYGGFERWPAPAEILRTQLGLPAASFRRRLDVLHSPGFAPPLWGRAPRVMSLHDLSVLERPELLPTGVSRWYWGSFLPFAARRAHALVVPSRFTAEVAERRLGVPGTRIRHIPYPPGASFAPAAPERVWAVRKRFRLHRPYILGVGAQEPRKDWAAVVRALAILRRSCPHQLVLAGSVNVGAAADALHHEIHRWNLDRRVRRLGYVASKWLAPLYTAADAFVFPETYAGYGLPPLEAMACGTPVVTFDNTALPETCAGAASLVPPPYRAGDLAAALLDLLRNNARREELRRRGFARVAELSWMATARATLAVYQEFARC